MPTLASCRNVQPGLTLAVVVLLGTSSQSITSATHLSEAVLDHPSTL